jgi:hypothetical protein
MEYQHTPLNHERPSIRLVQVLPILSANSLVQCKISQHILPVRMPDQPTENIGGGDGRQEYYDDMPSYMCLSYAWGSPEEQIDILVDGKPFYVRRNLYDFLTIACQTLASTWLWIDAQVQQMGKIYTGAMTVLVWLGDDAGAERVLREINTASKYSILDAYEEAIQDTPLWNARPLFDFDLPVLRFLNNGEPSLEAERIFNLLSDTTGGKIEKLFEGLVENEYWSRAWVSILWRALWDRC